jgi:hypothetical protein
MEQQDNGKRDSEDKMETGAKGRMSDEQLQRHFQHLEASIDVEMLRVVLSLFDGFHPGVAFATMVVANLNMIGHAQKALKVDADLDLGLLASKYIEAKAPEVVAAALLQETDGNA